MALPIPVARRLRAQPCPAVSYILPELIFRAMTPEDRCGIPAPERVGSRCPSCWTVQRGFRRANFTQEIFLRPAVSVSVQALAGWGRETSVPRAARKTRQKRAVRYVHDREKFQVAGTRRGATGMHVDAGSAVPAPGCTRVVSGWWFALNFSRRTSNRVECTSQISARYFLASKFEEPLESFHQPSMEGNK